MFNLAGVAVALKQAMSPEFKAYQMQVLANCKALSSALIDHGYKIVTGEFHVYLFFKEILQCFLKKTLSVMNCPVFIDIVAT